MILIGTPTKDLLYSGFVFDLVNLIKQEKNAHFAVLQGTILSNLRTLFVRKAIESKASHILFIDSDMRFPPNTLSRLLSRNLPIVGANCKQRQKDEFTARLKDSFVSSKDKTGLQMVDTIGFGVTLIDVNVFKKIPEPWFNMPFDGDKYVGEDVYFCGKAKWAGFDVIIDHDLSQEIKHAGLIEFGI